MQIFAKKYKLGHFLGSINATFMFIFNGFYLKKKNKSAPPVQDKCVFVDAFYQNEMLKRKIGKTLIMDLIFPTHNSD